MNSVVTIAGVKCIQNLMHDNYSVIRNHKIKFLKLQKRFLKIKITSQIKDMQVSPAPLGVIITGVDLKKDISDDLIDQFKRDVHKHRLLIFKNQGTVSGQRHVEISQWFGPFESTFYKHPKSPHPDIFRVSNIREEGCTNVGRTGWHIDGSFMKKPFAYSIYHMVSIPKVGNTGKCLETLFRSICYNSFIQAACFQISPTNCTA
jgi:alpha-ketoglutarate-dependent taurine dioxygenase